MRKRKGFTLIEMMIVILVIAVLATIVGLAVRSAGERSKQATLKAHLKAINDALTLARNDSGMQDAAFTPAQLTSETAPSGAQEWHGPYITEWPTHPYGGTYVYDTNTKKYVSAASS